MDQMASIGTEFDKASLDRIFNQAVEYYQNLAAMEHEQGLSLGPQWAIDPIYRNNMPVRPWALGEIQQTSGMIHWLSGNAPRTPGLYRQTDPHTEHDQGSFLLDTNERIHSSVRVRLACAGLGLNDQGTWTCPSMAKWKLKRTSTKYKDPVPRNPTWGMNGDSDRYGGRRPNEKDVDRYVWEYAGPERDAPTDSKQRVLVEEPLGPYERYLLKVAGGRPNVYDFAEEKEVQRRPTGRDRDFEDKPESDSEWEDEEQQRRSKRRSRR